MKTSLRLSLALWALLLSAGCMKMGTDYRRPDTGMPIPASFQHGQIGTSPGAPEDRWWEAFGDPDLNRVVDEVLTNNLDIKKATARILEIQSRFIQARADRFPTVNLQGEAQRQRVPATTSSTGVSQKRETETYGLSLPTSFELDLWGRLARGQEAARADLLQAEENRLTVAQTMVAEAVTLYLQMESLERRIQVAEKRIDNYQRSLALVEIRYARGLTDVLDLRQSRRTLAQAEAALPALRQDLGTTQQKLSVLLGRYAKTEPPRLQPEDYFKRLAPVPPGLPSDLLLRRPDIRAAEAALVALNARVGVAKANRFPRITLTGNLGYSSDQLNHLFKPDSHLWNMALGVVQPLFDAGKLKAGQRAAGAAFKQGLITYAKTILTAFSEVEQALLTRKEQLERRDLLIHYLREARAAQEVAENRYRKGLVDYLSVLVAQIARYNAEEQVVLSESSVLTNRVSLHRALGGGWAQMKQ